MAFADPIKQILAKTLGMTVNKLEEHKNKHTPLLTCETLEPSGEEQIYPITDFRRIHQDFGEATKSVFGSSIWVTLTLSNIMKSKKDIIIITDLRFEIEYNTLEVCNHMLGKDLTTIQVQGVESVDKHISEKPLNVPFDYVLDNSKQDNTLKEWVSRFKCRE